MFETLNISICCHGDEFIRTSAEVLTGNRNKGDRKVYGDGLVWPAGHSFTENDTGRSNDVKHLDDVPHLHHRKRPPLSLKDE